MISLYLKRLEVVVLEKPYKLEITNLALLIGDNYENN